MTEEQIIVGLWDQEEDITIDNRDIDTTWIWVRSICFEVRRNELEEIMDNESETLADEGIELKHNNVTLVLYLEDFEYLIENMDENNEED